jgi:hypothetical protein
MGKLSRNFVAGRMNKTFDERVVPNGEYIDAMNIRMGSTEDSEIGVLENTKGNIALSRLAYSPFPTFVTAIPLSPSAKCIGAVSDDANETIYWFVTDPQFINGVRLDMIVSLNVLTDILTYHVVSYVVLNFNANYLITGANIIGDLLFFTNDYNPPRFINTKKTYNTPLNTTTDDITAEELLVIKKPPLKSPVVQPLVTNSQSTYMDTRFICFAYRYKYADGEYSATSQWSAPSFVPKPFQFSINSYLNEGMTNACNTAIITYNTGGPLVVGIDLLFKQMSSNVIKVIEKINKKQAGFGNNQSVQFTFDNSKIFTILPESELLRLYDNVPRFAKAQTLMGNRLMYGNYIEGYNLIDKNDAPVKLEYQTTLISEIIGESSLPDGRESGQYTIDTTISIPNCIVTVDFTGANLVQGAILSVELIISHADFSGTIPTEQTDPISINFSFFLPQDFTSVYQMATSSTFQNTVGTSLPLGNIQTVFPANSCTGITFTDAVNCALPATLSYSGGTLTKYKSGISVGGQAIEVITSPGSNVIGLKIIAMRYVNNTTTPTVNAYEYYSYIFAEATFQEIGNPRSLHSNRGYQIGMVYMDEFHRSSTALVSTFTDTEHIPCGYADRKNSIQVTIPTTQIAPYWATRYKFVIKPDQENYETIYSSLFFKSPTTNEVYFLLEGENPRKIEKGDRLIVKADSNGPTQTCVYATVLDTQAQAEGFIEPVSEAIPPAGVYMKISPNDFVVVDDPESTVAPGYQTRCADPGEGAGAILTYPMSTFRGAGYDPANPSWEYEDYSVPAGSKITLNFRFVRRGSGGGNRQCERREYTLDLNLISSNSYDNMYEWWIGDDVESLIDTGIKNVGGSGCPIDNEFIQTLMTTVSTGPFPIPSALCTNYYQFARLTDTNELVLVLRGTDPCTIGIGGNDKRQSCTSANAQVFRSNNLFIFETEPQDSLPDIFFENDLSFSIDEDGYHSGNVQTQTSTLPAIVDTGFFNCFTFGNGAESYKIRDSIVGVPMNLGNRVTQVSAQDYKESDRFADITYSGIFNAESNVNKLNEFNLGLLNYKRLETSFGEIFKMDGRQTDVLVLQEDKISYVLAGKNLLSDSAAGGAITSVPEVLGTQIARTDKYGISFNPESYVQWGSDRYFTDAKRGVVLQLRGDSYSNEQLMVISDANMRTWFRDEFNRSFNTQKLGGYDPYSNEYVLVSNNRLLPINPECIPCRTNQTLTLNNPIDPESGYAEFNYCVDVGTLVGLVGVEYNVQSIADGATFNVIAVFNGTGAESGFVDENGGFSFDKNIIYNEVANIIIQYTGPVTLSINVYCPAAKTLRIVQIVLTINSEAGDTIDAQYRYTNGTFTGALQSNFVTFASGTDSPLVSWYNIVSGSEGNPGFPPSGSTMRMQTNLITATGLYQNPSRDKFKYLKTQTLYNNNTIDINALLSNPATQTATPIVSSSSTLYYADFIVPIDTTNPVNYLYLIWDLTSSVPSSLCYDATDINAVCCECTFCGPSECIQVTITPEFSEEGFTTVQFSLGSCGVPGLYEVTLKDTDPPITVCVNSSGASLNYQITEGNPILTIDSCGCTP